MKTAFFVLVSLLLFVGGLVIMGYAVTLPAFQALVFFSGIISVTLAFFIPIMVLPKTD